MKAVWSHGGSKVVAVMATAAALAACPLTADGGAAAQIPARTHRFDIPAQPLARALAQFATVSGIDIAYRQSLAAGRRSSPIRGEHTAPVALQMLLQGTGLAARFTGARAAIIYEPGAVDAVAPRRGASAAPALRLDMAEVRAPVMIGTRDRGGHHRYAMAVQGEIRELLRTDGAYEGRAFRLEIRIAVDVDGVIREVTIRRPSGEPDWDRHVVAALTGRALSSPPPEDLSEPLSFEIVSDPLPDPRSGRARRP